MNSLNSRGDSVSKPTGLGKGVNLLFGDQEDDEKFFECQIDKIIPNKYQPRSNFDQEELHQLANSIRENGIIQPLIVSLSEKEGAYNLIAGERRLRASKLAGLSTVPVLLRDEQNDISHLELAIIENVQRTDLNPMEEAEAYNRLIEKFGYTQDETAKRVGKKRTTITNMLRLLNLPQFVKDDLISCQLTEGHARSLLRINHDGSLQKQVRDQIINNKLSVRQTEKLIRRLTTPSRTKPAAQRDPDPIPASYIKALTTQLTNKLNSNVSIQQNGTRGKVEIDFYSLDDLERLISLILNQSSVKNINS
jgi:ParB family chromosome partitioning protein